MGKGRDKRKRRAEKTERKQHDKKPLDKAVATVLRKQPKPQSSS